MDTQTGKLPATEQGAEHIESEQHTGQDATTGKDEQGAAAKPSKGGQAIPRKEDVLTPAEVRSLPSQILGFSQKCLYEVLYLFWCNRGSWIGQCEAGGDALSKALGVKPQHIYRRILPKLIEIGLVAVTKRTGVKARNVYTAIHRKNLPSNVQMATSVQIATSVQMATTSSVQMATTSGVQVYTHKTSIRQRKTINMRNAHTQAHSDKVIQQGFDEFWAVYPKKKDKARAKKAFDKAMKEGASLEVMLAALERQRLSADWQKDGGQFIPHATTWLNGKRWEDETDIALPSKPEAKAASWDADAYRQQLEDEEREWQEQQERRGES